MTIDVYSPFPNQCGQLWFERRLSQDSGLHRLSLLSISSHPSPQIAKVDPKHATTERGVYINIIQDFLCKIHQFTGLIPKITVSLETQIFIYQTPTPPDPSLNPIKDKSVYYSYQPPIIFFYSPFLNVLFFYPATNIWGSRPAEFFLSTKNSWVLLSSGEGEVLRPHKNSTF